MTLKIKTILHHAFFGILAYMAAGHVMWVIQFRPEYGLPPIPAVLLSISLFLFASSKIITYRHRRTLLGQNKIVWKKQYAVPTVCMYAIMLVACFVYTQIVDTELLYTTAVPGVTDPSELAQMRLDSSVNMMVLFFGCLYIWTLFFHLMFTDRHRNYFWALIQFIKKYVTIYLLYRLIIFILTLVASLIMGMGQEKVQSDYFMLVLDDEVVQSAATGFLSGGGFLAGVTAASSFFVLSNLAQESLTGTGASTFRGRFRRMIFDVDTIKLLIMTVTCTLFSLLTAGGEMEFLEKLISAVLVLLWGISMIMFLVNTNMTGYLLHFVTMGFVERLIPLPQTSGVIGILLAILVTLVRIGLFSAIALMIANYDLRRSNQSQPKSDSLSARIGNATFMDAILLLIRVSDMGLKGLRKDTKPTDDEEFAKFIVSLAQKADGFLQKLLSPLKVTDNTP